MQTWRHRFAIGMVVMGLSVVGLPFLLFIPLAMLLGCWQYDDKPRHPLHIGEAVPSYLITVAIGACCYYGLYLKLI